MLIDQHPRTAGTRYHQIRPSIIIQIDCLNSGRTLHRARKDSCLVTTQQLVLIDDDSSIVVLNGQIHLIVVRHQFECGRVYGMPGYEREAAGLIAEARAAIIAKQHRLFAQQKQIKVVIVVKIEPDGFSEMPFGELCGKGFKFAVMVHEQRCAG